MIKNGKDISGTRTWRRLATGPLPKLLICSYQRLSNSNRDSVAFSIYAQIQEVARLTLSDGRGGRVDVIIIYSGVISVLYPVWESIFKIMCVEGDRLFYTQFLNLSLKGTNNWRVWHLFRHSELFFSI